MASTAKASASLKKTEKLLRNDQFSQAYARAQNALEDRRDKERNLLMKRTDETEHNFLALEKLPTQCKWEESARYFEKLCKDFSEKDAAKEGLRAALARLTESRTGNFDFAKLYEFAEKGIKDIDVADYMGPIEVSDIPGKGKGVVATTDVKKGTLLLVSKALAIVGDGQSVGAVALAVKEKLKRRPEMTGDVNALYDGNPREAEAPPPQGIPDIDRLAKICKYNCFSFDGKGGFNGWQFKGLWTLPSYFNHSCLRNAVHTFYFDVMTVFAVDEIKEGEEVTLTYTDPLDAYKERKKFFKNYGFTCQCLLCELDRSDARYVERLEHKNAS
ncbi:hypothetical protein AAVH_16253 [Aphelenchoides avenae]|nr:hypothetical protein AAVH_16253 [Aphelenchus avenae]